MRKNARDVYEKLISTRSLSCFFGVVLFYTICYQSCLVPIDVTQLVVLFFFCSIFSPSPPLYILRRWTNMNRWPQLIDETEKKNPWKNCNCSSLSIYTQFFFLLFFWLLLVEFLVKTASFFCVRQLNNKHFQERQSKQTPYFDGWSGKGENFLCRIFGRFFFFFCLIFFLFCLVESFLTSIKSGFFVCLWWPRFATYISCAIVFKSFCVWFPFSIR